MAEIFIFFLISLFKYFTVAVLPYFIFWKWFPEKFQKYKIQKQERQKPQVGLEMQYSLIVIIVQSIFFATVYWGVEKGVFNIYRGFGSQGYLKEILAFVVYFIVYDTYFYWSHRLLHWGWLYKKIHVVHHRSLNPTPLAIYSFHPLEGVISLLYFYPILFVFPMSFEMFLLLLFLTDLGNLGGHLGFEFLPKKFINSRFGDWVTTPTHHNIHHQLARVNYGLYWNGWDKIFKTLHAKTREEFNQIGTTK